MADAYYTKFQQMVAYLPAPAVEGYQARSLLRQGSFEPGDRFSRSNTEVSSCGAGGMTIRVSKKAVFNLLCGNISQQEFQSSIFGPENANLFKLAYNRGETIRAVELKQGGLDIDDDQIEFAIDIDWDRINIRSSAPASRLSRLLITIKNSRACKKIKNWINAFRRSWAPNRDS